MNRYCIALIALCGLTLFGSSVAAQQPNTSELRLVVVDESGAGIPAATVTVTPTTGEPVTFMGDDAVGRLHRRCRRSATIAVDYPGFEAVSVPVTLRRGAVNQTVTLKIAELKGTSSSTTPPATAPRSRPRRRRDASGDDALRTMQTAASAARSAGGAGGATFFMNGFREASPQQGRNPRVPSGRTRSRPSHDAGRASIEIITRPSPNWQAT
jgi:hypothetical protein